MSDEGVWKDSEQQPGPSKASKAPGADDLSRRIVIN